MIACLDQMSITVILNSGRTEQILEDESREGGPKSAVTYKNIAAVRKLVEDDSLNTVSEIQETLEGDWQEHTEKPS